jgi:hypothetical protein
MLGGSEHNMNDEVLGEACERLKNCESSSRECVFLGSLSCLPNLPAHNKSQSNAVQFSEHSKYEGYVVYEPLYQ